MTEWSSWSFPDWARLTVPKPVERPEPTTPVIKSVLPAYAAARRIRKELGRADEGNYGRHGWASYLSREDVDAVVAAVIGGAPSRP